MSVPALNNLGYVVDWPAEKEKYPHLQNLPLQCIDASKIGIILGLPEYRLQMPLECREGPRGSPTAIRTKLGWVAFSHVPAHSRTVQVCRISVASGMDAGVEDSLSISQCFDKWFRDEAIPAPKRKDVLRSVEDEKAYKLLKENTKRIPGKNAFESGILWRDSVPVILNNRQVAEAHLRALENRLEREPALKSAYDPSIVSDVANGYIRKMSKEEAASIESSSSTIGHHLLHHPVRNPKKPGKIRRVYNAAARFQGKCLNDFILCGPDLLGSLFGILVRFREGLITLCADAKDMYLMLRLRQEDKPALRFLYRSDSSQAPDVYQCERRIFGECSAPACANYTVLVNAEEQREEFPQAAASLENNRYMDDTLDSVESEEEAACLCKNLSEVMKRGGFHLTKWASNSPEVLAEIPESDRAEIKEIGLQGSPAVRTLGVVYEPATDTFRITAPSKKPAKTPREILSFVSSIWDPLGLVSPFVIRGRMFLQGLWPLKLDWDDVIDEEKLHEWTKFEREAKSLDELSFPRCYRRQKEAADDFQLHVFSDSSMQAKCAVAYYRFRYENGEVGVSLVSSRVRVTPLKRVTIPRLELDAVRMGINLVATIVEESSVKVQRIVLWTDSLICRHWLTQPSRRYKDYVAHRIVDFQERVVSLEQNGVKVDVRYVPTEVNVADFGTRGASPPCLDHDSSWQKGPAFLRSPENDWPSGRSHVCDDPSQLRKSAHSGTVCVYSESSLVDLEDYSTLWKAKRVVACVSRCVQKFQSTLTKASVVVNRPPSVEELQQAENVLIRGAQRESFGREIDCLVQGEPIPKNSKLVTLTPFIDDKGLLRSTYCGLQIKVWPVANRTLSQPTCSWASGLRLQ